MPRIPGCFLTHLPPTCSTGCGKAWPSLLRKGCRPSSRHARYAEAIRRAVRAWGLDIVCRNPAEYSSTLTAVLLPDGYDADRVRQLILSRYNMSLGAGLGKLAGRVFRIGHLGDLGELSLAGALCGVEMGLAQAGVPIARDGVGAALSYLGPDAAP